jgi:hypothetical protein
MFSVGYNVLECSRRLVLYTKDVALFTAYVFERWSLALYPITRQPDFAVISYSQWNSMVDTRICEVGVTRVCEQKAE